MRIEDLEKPREDEGLTSFYISFSDLMVLLGVFFLMLISMSKIDVGSFEKIKTSFSGSTKGTLIELANDLRKIVEGQPGVPGVEVQLAPDGVRLNLDTGALFEIGSARLKDNALEPLRPLLQQIIQTSYTVDVEGHTDDLPLHRYYRIDDERMLETNWSLSGKRAASVIEYLIQFGLPAERLRLVGYAANRPLQTVVQKIGSDLEKARSQNRRVTLLIK